MKVSYAHLFLFGLIGSVVAFFPACFERKAEAVKEQTLYVINVLDKDSYQDCRIAGSVHVPFEQVESFAKGLSKTTELVVYCSNYMCSSSMVAAQQLKAMGFEHVWVYEGGTAEWYQMSKKFEGSYPVEGACRASYLSAANEKPAELDESPVEVISAKELQQKMQEHGLLAKAPSV